MSRRYHSMSAHDYGSVRFPGLRQDFPVSSRLHRLAESTNPSSEQNYVGQPCWERSMRFPSGSATRYSASRFGGRFWISDDAPNPLQSGLSSSIFSTSMPK